MLVPLHIIELARKESLKSEMRHQLGAVIFNRRGYVLSVGHNRFIYTPKKTFIQNRKYWSVHAEVDAIQQLSVSEAFGNYIYVHRSNGRCAKPCEDCEIILKRFGIKKIFWSDNDT